MSSEEHDDVSDSGDSMDREKIIKAFLDEIELKDINVKHEDELQQFILDYVTGKSNFERSVISKYLKDLRKGKEKFSSALDDKINHDEEDDEDEETKELAKMLDDIGMDKEDDD